MGGLFTEAKPEALPPGASPRSINCDYIIGSVKPRPGKLSAFTYANEFFESPASFTQSVSPGVRWSAGSVTLNGSSAGGPGLQNARIVVSAAQLASAQTVPVPLIPAPGPNRIVVPFNVFIRNNGASYVGGTPGSLLGLGSTPAQAINGMQLFLPNGIYAGAGDNWAMTPLTDAAPFASLNDADAVNQPLSLVNTGSMGTGTGGIILDVQYLIVNVKTGAITGGCQSVFGSMTALSNAQINASIGVGIPPADTPGTPVVLVAAPGLGKIIVPISALIVSSGAMDINIQPSIGFGLGWTDAYSDSVFSMSPFNKNGYIEMDAPLSWDTSGPVPAGNPINQPLVFICEAPGSGLSTGGATATVYVQYAILDVNTGNLTDGGQGDFQAGFRSLSASDIVAASNGAQTPIVAAPGVGLVSISPICEVETIFNGIAFPTGITPFIGSGPLIDSNNFPANVSANLNAVSAQESTQAPSLFKYPLATIENSPIDWTSPQVIAAGPNSGANVSVQYLTINMATGAITGGGTPCGGGGSGPTSQTLQALNFNLKIPVNVPQGKVATGCGSTYGFVTPTNLPVTGVEVEITGSQTNSAADAMLEVQLQLPDGTLSPVVHNVQLPASTGTVIVGSPTDLWGFTATQLNAALLNDPNFTVNIVAVAPGGETVTFTVSVEVLVAFSVPDPPPDINYLKTFEQQDGDLFTLVLGSNGVIYREDVINNPNVLTPVYTEIEPDSFAESCTQDDREFMAFSDLQSGTDMPYGYDGANFDRLSQVGPGAPPTASGSSAGGAIPIISITQPPVMSDPEGPGRFEDLLWSGGPGDISPGNVLTVYYGRSYPPGPLHVPDPNLAIGVGVHIAGTSPINGQVINGDYIVTSVGEGIPPGGEYGRWYFTVQQIVTQYANLGGGVGNGPFGTYQVTTATLTAAQQVPNVQVGTKIEIAGTGGSPPSGYDGAWIVTQALNAAQMQINSTQRTGGVATYAFTLLSGTAPVAGQQVSVGGTLNGNGVFNAVNATIQSVTGGIGGGTFLLSLPGADIPVAPENGTGIIFGTKFTFEPGTVVGNKTGGTVVATGGQFSSGQRKLCYSFLTRNGFLTQPSPIATVDITIGSTGITVSNLLAGPTDVVARIVHLTAADGGQFYNIPIPVLVTDPVTGQVVVNDSTWINDNTSTSATFSFSDDVLLAADEVDIQGNNLFEDIELGSSIMLIPYASRLFAVGEQNKVFNFVNWSFDGGIAGGPGGTTYPAGWAVDPVNGAGGSMVNSPLFGFAYQISNQTGSPQAFYGMITQDAFEDENSVPIINASTTYSIRVTAAAVAAIASGTLVADLFSPSVGVSLGSFSIPLSSLTTKMQIFTGTILTASLSPVPKDLVWRIYAANISDGAVVLIDREEPFPTEQPNLNTQIIGSYQGNFEAFDRLTGPIECGVQNQQPVRSAFTLFDALYIVKSGSFLAVSDNQSTEPAFWNRPRVISNSVGTPSIYGVTSGIDDPNSGEEWALIFGRTGLYIFNGGEPIKLTEEIQSVVQQVNWRYGHTLWVKNDIDKRRILIGVPMKTYITDSKGNIVRPLWFPEGVIPDDTNPTTPNVVLELYYGQLNTAGDLSGRVGVHQSYSGKLIDSEVTRKWSIWTIKAPAAAFLKRQDSTIPIFLGNSDGNGKVFELVDGLLEDDGSPMMQLYIPYGFAQSQESEARQLNVVRMSFQYMTLVIDGSGSLTITAFPNSLDSIYTHTVDPPIDLPASTNGDVELPLNESASRLFLQFGTQCVGAGFILTRIVMVMRQEPWSAVRGN